MFKGLALLLSIVLYLFGFEVIGLVLMVNIVMIMELEERVIKQIVADKSKVKKTRKVKTYRKIRIYNDNGFDKTYNSAIMACRELGLSSGNLSNVISGKFKHTRGYQAEYID